MFLRLSADGLQARQLPAGNPIQHPLCALLCSIAGSVTHKIVQIKENFKECTIALVFGKCIDHCKLASRMVQNLTAKQYLL